MSQSLRIVVADDELDMRDYYQRILPRLGHQVAGVASTGMKLLELGREVRPDLILTDIKMPGIDGIEAVRQLCAELPVAVLLVSAHFDERLQQRIKQFPFAVYLLKPVKQADLATSLSLAMLRFEQKQADQQSPRLYFCSPDVEA